MPVACVVIVLSLRPPTGAVSEMWRSASGSLFAEVVQRLEHPELTLRDAFLSREPPTQPPAHRAGCPHERVALGQPCIEMLGNERIVSHLGVRAHHSVYLLALARRKHFARAQAPGRRQQQRPPSLEHERDQKDDQDDQQDRANTDVHGPPFLDQGFGPALLPNFARA